MIEDKRRTLLRDAFIELDIHGGLTRQAAVAAVEPTDRRPDRSSATARYP
ncbi:hypothetical protein BVI2075_960082 [Burkholderia vietnamiensis]|nr:hypothetical protein BVI2075_960082 [Burkholderia vietnamiensis]